MNRKIRDKNSIYLESQLEAIREMGLADSNYGEMLQETKKNRG